MCESDEIICTVYLRTKLKQNSKLHSASGYESLNERKFKKAKKKKKNTNLKGYINLRFTETIFIRAKIGKPPSVH